MDHIEHFRTQGYVIIPGYFNSKETAKLQAVCDATPVAMGETWEHQWVPPEQLQDQQYMHYWSKSIKDTPIDRDIIDPKIQQLIQDIFPGEPYIRYGSDFKVTMPGSTYFSPHFDTPYRYDHYCNDFDDRALGMQFAIALDDFTEQNGATRFVPGSHRREMLKSDIRSGRYDDELRDHGISFVGPAGSVLIYHSRTLHSTMPNNSNQRRRLMLSLTLHESILATLAQLPDSTG
jgi:ectoine hydroxylase-related dioxygenase (phytanoyl-CoA dioxygenase family)